MERLQGWHPDPTGRHQERYFSQGVPTHLFRDGNTEGYDDRAGFPTTVSYASEEEASRGSSAGDSNVAGSPPPGWYPDPLDSNYQRVWDGTQWTEQTQLRSVQAGGLEPGPTGPVQGPSSDSSGAPGAAPRFCVHCGSALGEEAKVGDQSRNGTRSQTGGDSYSPSPSKVPTNGHDSYVAQVDHPWQTMGRETNEANGTVAISAPVQTPVVVPDPVPSPGWYPVQGAPEMVRWWDGSQWGDVRYTDPPTAEVPSPPAQYR